MVQIDGARVINLGLKVEHFQTLILYFEKISFRLLQSSKGHEKLKESFSNIGDTLRVIRTDTAFLEYNRIRKSFFSIFIFLHNLTRYYTDGCSCHTKNEHHHCGT